MKKILETERLYLREMTMDDFESLYNVLADTNIMQHYPYVFDDARVVSWIERNMKRYSEDGFGLWAVCLKESGEMIGDCGLTLQNIDGQMLPEIGYHIRADCKYTNVGSYKTAEAIGMHFLKEYPEEANKITHVSVIYREDLGL